MNFFLGYLNRKKKKSKSFVLRFPVFYIPFIYPVSPRRGNNKHISSGAQQNNFTIIIGQLESHDRGDAYPHFDKRNALRYEIEFEKEFVAISNSFKSQRTYIIKIYNFEVIIEVKKKKKKEVKRIIGDNLIIFFPPSLSHKNR